MKANQFTAELSAIAKQFEQLTERAHAAGLDFGVALVGGAADEGAEGLDCIVCAAGHPVIIAKGVKALFDDDKNQIRKAYMQVAIEGMATKLGEALNKQPRDKENKETQTPATGQ